MQQHVANGNKLWQCPLKVERGSYGQMPADWRGAIVSFYVGAPSHEEALTKAVQVLRHKGMIFVDLVDGKVMQLDPDKWWDGHVMSNFSEYYREFPAQDQIASIVSEGLVFHGPFFGWDRE
jgi:hypothetical protein